MDRSKRKLLKRSAQWAIGIALSPVIHLLAATRTAQAQGFGGTDFGVPFLNSKSPGYKAATRTYYPSPCSTPQKVYQPKDEQELGQLIVGLRSRGERFAVRGGGHSFDNRSSNSNIVIDTSNLKGSGNGAQLNPKNGIVTVRAGTRLGGREINPKKTKLAGLYDVLAQNNRILAAGTCPDVGVIGNILGGSLSAIPHFGYGAAGLTEVTFVSFKDGKTYNVNAGQISVVDGQGRKTPVTIPGLSSADLLKVFKGGGQGSLGVVTEVKLQSHKMSEFRAASITPPKGSLEDTIKWVSSLDPATRRQVYFESHLNEDGSSSQIVRALAPATEWPGLVQRLSLEGRVKEHSSAKEFIDTYLDKEGINSNGVQTRGANLMVPIDNSAINFAALRAAAKMGVDTALYQGPSSDGTILPGSSGSIMIEMEGNQSHGDLNKLVLATLAKGPRRRFVNYVTTGVPANAEEYFDKSNVALIQRAMDEFNPKTMGIRLSTSSLIDASTSPAQACDTFLPKTAPSSSPPSSNGSTFIQ